MSFVRMFLHTCISGSEQQESLKMLTAMYFFYKQFALAKIAHPVYSLLISMQALHLTQF